MTIIGRILGMFSRAGRDEDRLRRAMELAHAKRPAEAVAIYDALIEGQGTSPSVRARALFNRALAHSSLKEDRQAIADLEQVITLSGTPENVLSAARNQLVRVRNRIGRGQDRADAKAANRST